MVARTLIHMSPEISSLLGPVYSAALVVTTVFVATLLVAILSFAGGNFISGSSAGFLLHLTTANASSGHDLWLGISGSVSSSSVALSL